MSRSCHREYHPALRKRQQMDSGNKRAVQYDSETISGEKERSKHTSCIITQNFLSSYGEKRL